MNSQGVVFSLAKTRLCLLQIARKTNTPVKDLTIGDRHISVKANDNHTSLWMIVAFYQRQENNKEKFMSKAEALAFIKEKFFDIKRVYLSNAVDVTKCVIQIAGILKISVNDLTVCGKHLAAKAEDGLTSLGMIILFYRDNEIDLISGKCWIRKKRISHTEALAYIKEIFFQVKDRDSYLNDPAIVKMFVLQIARKLGLCVKDLSTIAEHRSTKADDNQTSLWMIIDHYMKKENNKEKNMSKAEALAYIKEKFFNINRVNVDLSDPETVKAFIIQIANKLGIPIMDLTTISEHQSTRADNDRTSLGMIITFYREQENNHEKYMSQVEALDYIKKTFFGIKDKDSYLNDPVIIKMLMEQIAKKIGIAVKDMKINLEHMSIKADDNRTSLQMILDHYRKMENNKEKLMTDAEALAYIKDKFFGISRELDRNDLLINEIEELGLTDAVSLIGHDPLRMKQYINVMYPEFSEEKLNDLVSAAFHGLRVGSKIRAFHKDYSIKLARPVRDHIIKSTGDDKFVLSGKVAPGTPFLQLLGPYYRKIVPNSDGTFSAVIPLPTKGAMNEFVLYGFDPVTKHKSAVIEVNVLHTGANLAAQEAFEALISSKKELLADVRKNPGRWQYLLKIMEQVYIRHFTYSVEDGFRILVEKIQGERSRLKKAILEAVLEKFRQVENISVPLNAGEHLYFFEKYCIYHILEAKKAGRKGIILANEPGMGKTMTVLSALAGSEAVIVAPNSVVTTWGEQASKFFSSPSIQIVEGPYVKRDEQLRNLRKRQVVVNVEFMRNMSPERIALLSRSGYGFIVIDESDYLGSKDSLQTEGTHMLRGAFKILMSATPFKKPGSLCHVLRFLSPNDPRFQKGTEFARAYQTNDVKNLNALHLLLNGLTIRFRKKDVFESYDPNIPLEEQSHRLPKQVYVGPKETGDFTLSPEQCSSILHLFTDYQSWCRAHRISGKISDEDREYVYFTEGYFSKKEALRQIMNDPIYFGRHIESPKHKKMDEIIGKELDGNGRKAIIFCRYRAQVEEYAKRYAKYGVCTYYGGVTKKSDKKEEKSDKNKVNSDGYMVGDDGKVIYYRTDGSGNYVFDGDHNFIPSNSREGRPLHALDRERLMFQNDPKKRVFIATYDVGSLGITLSAADVVISDDLASTYRDQFQSDDRAHRIDNERKKYNIKYYRLRAKYPKDFLERLKQIKQNLQDKYFSMGTYDEVQYDNLDTQKKIFHRILDGVGDEEELEKMTEAWMKDHMPFMFENGKKPEEPSK